MVPIFIKSWNINLYGEWIILNVISALLALLDFGYINAATNRMTFELAYGNIRNTAEVFRSMIYIINITFLVYLTKRYFNPFIKNIFLIILELHNIYYITGFLDSAK